MNITKEELTKTLQYIDQLADDDLQRVYDEYAAMSRNTSNKVKYCTELFNVAQRIKGMLAGIDFLLTDEELVPVLNEYKDNLSTKYHKYKELIGTDATRTFELKRLGPSR